MGVTIMNMRKTTAFLLVLVMLAGIISGCSKTTKISTDKFIKTCEKLKFKEFEFDDDAPEADDIEDGWKILKVLQTQSLTVRSPS